MTLFSAITTQLIKSARLFSTSRPFHAKKLPMYFLEGYNRIMKDIDTSSPETQQLAENLEYTAKILFEKGPQNAFALIGPEVGYKKNIAAVRVTEEMKKIIKNHGGSNFTEGDWVTIMNLKSIPQESKISSLEFAIFKYPGVTIKSTMHERLEISFDMQDGTKVQDTVNGFAALSFGILAKRLSGDSDFCLGEFYDLEGNKVYNPAQESNYFILGNPDLMGNFDATSFFDANS